MSEIEQLRHDNARLMEMVVHFRDVILCFNPKHYYVEQVALIERNEPSYWSHIEGQRRLRDQHEATIERLERELRKRSCT